MDGAAGEDGSASKAVRAQRSWRSVATGPTAIIASFFSLAAGDATILTVSSAHSDLEGSFWCSYRWYHGSEARTSQDNQADSSLFDNLLAVLYGARLAMTPSHLHLVRCAVNPRRNERCVHCSMPSRPPKLRCRKR